VNASTPSFDEAPRLCCDHHGGWADAPFCEDEEERKDCCEALLDEDCDPECDCDDCEDERALDDDADAYTGRLND
jgi:hypothetical protein